MKTLPLTVFTGLSVCLFGCATTHLSLAPDKPSFELVQPLQIQQGLLPQGTYRCYYVDEGGCYFEAPSVLRDGYIFSNGRSGGIYITQGEPHVAFVYFQDKRTDSTYVYGVGAISWGGSGGFKKAKQLENKFLDSIKIVKGE